MNCAYTGTCLLGTVVPERKCTRGRESPFLFWQENLLSSEAVTNREHAGTLRFGCEKAEGDTETERTRKGLCCHQ